MQVVARLVTRLAPDEVPFQQHYQTADLRALLTATFTHAQKHIAAMWARVNKHMAATSPGLVTAAWQQIEVVLVGQYETLLKQIAQIYPVVQPPMNAARLKQLLRTATEALPA